MSLLTAVGANLMCTMGTAPAPLKVTSQTKVMCEGKPAGTSDGKAELSALIYSKSCPHGSFPGSRSMYGPFQFSGTG